MLVLLIFVAAVFGVLLSIVIEILAEIRQMDRLVSKVTETQSSYAQNHFQGRKW